MRKDAGSSQLRMDFGFGDGWPARAAGRRRPESAAGQQDSRVRTDPGISVSELNRIIAETLRREGRLRAVTVSAEVSGFKDHFASGHWYFSLKDEASSIPCVMYRQNNLRAAIRPADGDRVTAVGYVDVYTKDGRVQFCVLEMKPAGLGNLFEQFEALKRKLSAEGLFDPSRKRVLPLVPSKVAVVTSASGAALHDILNVSGMRNPSIPIVLVPSSVQGAGAAGELISALEKAQRIPGAEVIILARGGGSPEDLWCFNDEALARAVAACRIPVVSGVGHEVDTTLCDLAADVRASTPSNAAEIVFPDRSELTGRIGYLRSGLTRAAGSRIHTERLRMLETRDRLQRVSPERRISGLTEQAGRAGYRLRSAMEAAVRAREDELRKIGARIPRTLDTAVRIREEDLRKAGARMPRAMETAIRAREDALHREEPRLRYGMEGLIRAREAALRQARIRLESISPLRVLDRGYALVYDGEDRMLPDARSAAMAEEMVLRFRDGRVRAVRKDG